LEKLESLWDNIWPPQETAYLHFKNSYTSDCDYSSKSFCKKYQKLIKFYVSKSWRAEICNSNLKIQKTHWCVCLELDEIFDFYHHQNTHSCVWNHFCLEIYLYWTTFVLLQLKTCVILVISTQILCGFRFFRTILYFRNTNRFQQKKLREHTCLRDLHIS
jgi:hypothetical protein